MKLGFFKKWLNLSIIDNYVFKVCYDDTFSRNDDGTLNIKGEFRKTELFYLCGNIDQCNHNVIMVAYLCHHLSDNNVDKSAFYVGSLEHYVDLSEKNHHN